jgi:hypothetical protein
MFNGERPRSEKPEAIKSPEQVVKNAVADVENKDAADPVTSSEWAQKAKRYSLKAGKMAGIGILIFPPIMLLKLLRFAGRMIDNPKNPESWFFSEKKGEK